MSNSFARLADRIEDWSDDITDEVPDAVDEGMDDAESATKRNLHRQDSVASGYTIGSVHTRPGGEPHLHSTALTVGAGTGAYLEVGTGAFSHTDSPVGPFPAPSGNGAPVENIQSWIDAKAITGDYYRARFDPERDTRGSPLAWAITNTINEIGTRAHPFLFPAWRRTKPRLVQRTENALSSTLTRM